MTPSPHPLPKGRGNNEYTIMKKYNPLQIEKKWQKYWQQKKTFVAKDFSKNPKKYVLVEFPYPSGEGLHMGHLRPYIAGDIYSRFLRMKGHEVLYPIGWDAFGLPAENFAIKHHIHPSISTAKNIKNAKAQLESWGTSFDWSREVNTTDPDYYKWTQWIFLKFFEAGLAYEATGLINWCPKDKTGLANEEVIDGKCDRCGTVVVKKELRQWYLKITAYAEKLLEGLKNLPEWPEAVKLQQENWIGKSVGAEIDFGVIVRSAKGEVILSSRRHSERVQPSEESHPQSNKEILRPSDASGTQDDAMKIKVFTTRPDTIFGATYMVVAPEHPLVQNLESRIKNYGEVRKYIEDVKSETETQRTSLEKEKTGVELKGIKAINPATKEEIPVWVADYVLWGYGTGAIMAVPAHDERDFEFAQKFNLPITQVVRPQYVGTVLLLHGTNGNGKNNWFPWLSEKLSALGYKVISPDMNDQGTPDLNKRLKVLEKYKDEINENSLVIGYSLGAPTALQFLMKFNKKIRHLFLVAPTHPDMDWEWYRDNHADSPAEAIQKVSQASLDWEKIRDLVAGTTALFSDNDEHIPLSVKDLYERDMQANTVVLKNKGHFGTSSGLKELPELMDEIIDSAIASPVLAKASVEYGTLINSGKFSGLGSEQAIEKMAKEFGKLTVQYKLRDWVFSRQRYWGEPIPIIHCEKCGIVAVPEKDLPVKLPEVENYEPTGTGESPLAAIETWVNVKCPKCKGPAKRETNTMPQWAGSSWYWLRYIDPKDKKVFSDKKKQKYWIPVDVYFGGMEHTTLHLLYSRFWNLFLYDQGLVTTKEPYVLRKPHGIILAADGEKMSKSRGNVVNPNEVVKKFGADTLRMYEPFLGPHEMTVSWNDKGILGVRRFLDRVWVWANEVISSPHAKNNQGVKDTEKVEKALHKLIKKVTEDLENMRFNTAVSSFMEFHNEIKQDFITLDSLKTFLALMYPFAPHFCEELYSLFGNKKSLQEHEWPKYNPALVIDQTVDVVVQVNGKVKAKLSIKRDSSQDEVKAEALVVEQVKKAVGTSEIKRVIYVPNKLINLVI